jgi:hypothetical protein
MKKYPLDCGVKGGKVDPSSCVGVDAPPPSLRGSRTAAAMPASGGATPQARLLAGLVPLASPTTACARPIPPAP